MRIVVVGGTGRLGSKVLQQLTERGHDVIAAAPSTGVDTLTGAGLDAALDDADVVVDASNMPSPDCDEARSFFVNSTLNLQAAAESAGVRHHVVLSLVGVDRLASVNGYHAAKLLQEELVLAGSLPYTIVRSTQSFEFLFSAPQLGAGGTVRVPPAVLAPIACADAAESLAIAAVGEPMGDVIEVSGPASHRLDEMIQTAFVARGDRRVVQADPSAPFRGIPAGVLTVLPSAGAIRFETRFEDWLLRSIVSR
ncbi:SDR family oxidoreductase [Mycobacterium sp. NPDC003323]